MICGDIYNILTILTIITIEHNIYINDRAPQCEVVTLASATFVLIQATDKHIVHTDAELYLQPVPVVVLRRIGCVGGAAGRGRAVFSDCEACVIPIRNLCGPFARRTAWQPALHTLPEALAFHRFCR